MLKEIKERYKFFGDAIISEIVFTIPDSKTSYKQSVTVVIWALNWQSNSWEKIQLFFIDVVKFRYEKRENRSSTIIFEAYFEKINEVIVFDFFALQISQDVVAEDPNSDFVIHCKELKYELIDTST